MPQLAPASPRLAPSPSCPSASPAAGAADRIPPLSAAERRRALAAAAAHALSRGITCVHDMGRIAYMEGEEAAWSDLEEVYAPAADAGALPLRVYAFVALPTW